MVAHVVTGMMVCLSLHGAPSEPRLLEERCRDLRAKVPAVRARAAVVLGASGDAAAVPPLISALGDPGRGVRREAARALGRLRDQRGVAPLMTALADADVNVRLFAAHALGEIRARRAVPALLKALADAAYCVREEAAWALREIRAPTLPEELEELLRAPRADVAHITWLLEHQPAARAAESLATLLGDREVRTRRRAVHALGRLKSPAAVAPLLWALRDGDLTIRRRAVEALRTTREERVLEAFRAAADREQDRVLKGILEEAVAVLSRDDRLLAHWSFDDRHASIARDVTERGVDGRILGCTPVKGKSGYALRFGPKRYVELGKPATLPISNGPMTVMAWVKTEAENGVVVARGGAFCGYALYVKGGVAKFGIHRLQEGPGFIAAGTQRVVGAWVHLAGVIKKNRIELYVNGKLAAAARTAGYLPSECGQGMEIGFDVGNSPAEICDSFEGIIDEVKAFRVALTAAEIEAEVKDAPSSS